MTDRLYYDDAYCREFEATVIDVQPRGADTAVWLDRTAFYPTSGGQPFDEGTLAGLHVSNVEDDDLGRVVHVVEGSAPSVGSVVHGAIDWPRRFDHMQQHTGQHVLSAAMERAFGARTLSFHLGTESSTIDVDRELEPARLVEAERAANQIVWNDVTVAVRYVTEEEARTLPLRKEPLRTGTGILRLVDVEGVDLSACGGTHVARTGAIGLIALGSWERFKGGQRIEFLCGERALRRFAQMRDVAAASIRLLSVLPSELPAAIERMQSELKEQRRHLLDAHTSLAGYEAAALVHRADDLAGIRFVARVEDGDGNRLKALALAVAEHRGTVSIVVSRATPVLAVAARAADVSLACQEVVSALLKQFGGRGGGRPDLAQCGGLQGTSDDVLAAARAAVVSIVGRASGPESQGES